MVQEWRTRTWQPPVPTLPKERNHDENPFCSTGSGLGRAGNYPPHAEAQEYLSDTYINFGYGQWGKSTFDRNISTTVEISGANSTLTGKGELDSSDDIYLAYGGRAGFDIPVNFELEFSYAKLKSKGSYTLTQSGATTPITSTGKTNAITLSANAVLEQELSDSFFAGIGAGIGVSKISTDNNTLSIGGTNFVVADEDETSPRLSTILRLGYQITEGARINLQHSLVRHTSSDTSDKNHHLYRVGLQFDL